jgi:hypothetical protein
MLIRLLDNYTRAIDRDGDCEELGIKRGLWHGVIRQAGALFVFIAFATPIEVKASGEPMSIETTKSSFVGNAQSLIGNTDLNDQRMITGHQGFIYRGWFAGFGVKRHDRYGHLCFGTRIGNLRIFSWADVTADIIFVDIDHCGAIIHGCVIEGTNCITFDKINCGSFADILIVDSDLNGAPPLQRIAQSDSIRRYPCAGADLKNALRIMQQANGYKGQNPGAYGNPLIGGYPSQSSKTWFLKYAASVAVIALVSGIALGGGYILLGFIGDGGIPIAVLLWLACLWIIYHVLDWIMG